MHIGSCLVDVGSSNILVHWWLQVWKACAALADTMWDHVPNFPNHFEKATAQRKKILEIYPPPPPSRIHANLLQYSWLKFTKQSELLRRIRYLPLKLSHPKFYQKEIHRLSTPVLAAFFCVQIVVLSWLDPGDRRRILKFLRRKLHWLLSFSRPAFSLSFPFSCVSIVDSGIVSYSVCWGRRCRMQRGATGYMTTRCLKSRLKVFHSGFGTGSLSCRCRISLQSRVNTSYYRRQSVLVKFSGVGAFQFTFCTQLHIAAHKGTQSSWQTSTMIRRDKTFSSVYMQRSAHILPGHSYNPVIISMYVRILIYIYLRNFYMGMSSCKNESWCRYANLVCMFEFA